MHEPVSVDIRWNHTNIIGHLLRCRIPNNLAIQNSWWPASVCVCEKNVWKILIKCHKTYFVEEYYGMVIGHLCAVSNRGQVQIITGSGANFQRTITHKHRTVHRFLGVPSVWSNIFINKQKTTEKWQTPHHITDLHSKYRRPASKQHAPLFSFASVASPIAMQSPLPYPRPFSVHRIRCHCCTADRF